MAGRPIYRLSVERILALGGEDFVFTLVREGKTMHRIADVCDISKGMLYEWLHKDEARWERYQEARTLAAYSLADEAQEILDTATPGSIHVDRERANIRKWQAEKANKKDFGKDAGVQVQLSLGDLHLTAVQATPNPEQIEEAEVIEMLPAPVNPEDLL